MNCRKGETKGTARKYLVQLKRCQLQSCKCNMTPLPVVLPRDTSPDGGGVVGSDRLAEGSEKPTSYISRTATKTERNDAQFEKEALGRIFGK